MLKSNIIEAIVLANPFEPNSREIVPIVNEGKTLEALLEEVKATCVVALNGRIVEPELWASTVPLPGDGLVIATVPAGGDESGGKTVLRLVAMVALTYFTMGAGAAAIFGAKGIGLTGFAAFAAQSAAFIGGTMLINAVLPPVNPKMPDSSLGASPSQTYGIDGPKNTSREGIPYPLVFGKHRQAGNIINTRTMNKSTNTQDLFVLVNAGEGEIAGFEDIEINDETIDSFSKVEVQTRNGSLNQTVLTDFTDASQDTSIGTTLEGTGDSKVITTDTATNNFEIDILFQQGLYKASQKTGKVQGTSVDFTLICRPQNHTAGEHIWYDINDEDLSNPIVLMYTERGAPKTIYLNKLGESDGTVYDEYDKLLVKRYSAVPLMTSGDKFSAVNRNTINEAPERSVEGYDISFELIGLKGETETVLRSNAGYYTTKKSDIGPGGVQMNSSLTEAVRRTVKSADLPLQKYEILVVRETFKPNNEDPDRDWTIRDAMTITTAREYRGVDGIAYVNTALLAIRVEVDNQINSLPKISFTNLGMLINEYERDPTNPSKFVATKANSTNPAWIVYAMYTNTRWGGALDPDRLSFEEFYEWAQICKDRGFHFNGVFDSRMNIWEAARAVAKIGRGSLVRAGTKIGVTIHAKRQMVQVFTEASIIKGTLSTNWMPVSDRANVIDCTFYDEENKNLPRTFRYYNDGLIESGQKFRPTELNLFGVVNYEQAAKECVFALNMNQLSQTISFDTDVQGISCRIGSVIGVQHSMPAWGIGGRVEAGSTRREVKLDRPVTMEAGKEYQVLVHYDYRSIYSLDDSRIGSADLKALFVPTMPPAEANRVFFSTEEYGIETMDYDETLGWFVILDRPAKRAATGNATFGKTDSIEIRTVKTVAGTTDTVELASGESNLPGNPKPLSQFSFGPAEKTVKKFIVTEIAGKGIETRTITALEYYDEIHDDELVTDLPNLSSFPTPDYSIRDVAGELIVYGNAIEKRRKINLIWDYHESNQRQRANVYARESDNAPFKLYERGAAKSCEYLVDNDPDLEVVDFKIIPISDTGQEVKPDQAKVYSLYLDADMAIPRPVSLITSLDNRSLTLYWQKGSSLTYPDATFRYEVYRSYRNVGAAAPTFPGDYALVDTTMEQFYRFDNLPTSKDCHYAVVAINIATPKDRSTEATTFITTPAEFGSRNTENGIEVWYSTVAIGTAGLGDPDSASHNWTKTYNDDMKTQAVITWTNRVFQPWAITPLTLDQDGMRYLGELDAFPSSPKDGDMFLHTDEDKYYLYRNRQWELFFKRTLNGLQSQFSPNGVQDSGDGDYNWSDTFRDGFDRFMRQSTDGGATWTESMLFVGEKGEDGRFMDYRFARGENPPAFDENNPNPAGYSDQPPTGEGNLWFIVAEKNSDGSFYGGSNWSAPVRLNGEDGKDGEPGAPGARGIDGDPAQFYKIGYPDGLALKSFGSHVTLNTQYINGGSLSTLSGSADPQLYDDADNPLGRSVTLNTQDVDGSKVIRLKSGGVVFDSVTVVDIKDGEDAIVGAGSHNNTLSWVKDKNNGPWSPSNNQTLYTVRFYKKGANIATRTMKVVRSDAGNITISWHSASGEPTTAAIEHNGTAAPTLYIEHTASESRVTETFNAVKGGDRGEDSTSLQVDKNAIQVVADQHGDVFEGLPEVITLTVHRGGEDDTANWSLTAQKTTGVTGSMSGNKYTVTGLEANSGKITFTAAREGFTNRVVTVSLSKSVEGRPGQTFSDIIPAKGGKWFFTTRSSLGWSAKNANLSATTRTLKVINDGSSSAPYIYKTNMNFNSDQNYLVAIRFRCLTAPIKNKPMYVYWAKPSTQTFESARSKNQRITARQNEYVTAIFDMRDESLWDADNVKGLRFDFKMDEDFEVDSLQIGRFGAGDDDETVANSKMTIGNDGTLKNGATTNGKVTIGGLGYRGSMDATNNPDSLYLNSNTTKSHVGLGSVPNWSDATFRSEAASQANSRIGVLRPDSTYKNSNVTKASVGLGSVPNWSSTTIRNEAASQANSRIGALRPDSTYKNSYVTKSSIGLGSVPNWSSTTIRNEAKNQALAQALLRNPEGAGLNFLNPIYFSPRDGIPMGSKSGLKSPYTLSSPQGHNGQLPANIDGGFRMRATTNDAYFYFSTSSTNYNMNLIQNKKWLVSWYGLRYVSSSNAPHPTVRVYIKTDDGAHTASRTTYKDEAWQSWNRRSVVVDLSAKSSKKGVLRFDIDNCIGQDYWVAGVMVEPLLYDNGRMEPSPLVPPLEGQPLLQTNRLPAAVTVGARQVLTSNVISSSADPSNSSKAKITINSHTLYTGDGPVSYGGKTLSGKSKNTVYYISIKDPYLNGGSDYHASTDIKAVINSNYRRYLGPIRTYNGGGTTTPGGEWCAHVDTWLTPTLQIKDAKVGDIIDGVTKGVPSKSAIQAIKFHEAECLRLVTKSGASKIVSLDTPIDRKDGSSFKAADVLCLDGEDLLVDINGKVFWEKIAKAEYVGVQPIAIMNCGDISYFGGETHEARVCTHNAVQKEMR